MLTPSVINREALAIFGNKIGTRGGAEQVSGQMYVDCIIQPSDLELNIDKFSLRYIIPAMGALADGIPAGAMLSSEMMELPKGVVGAAADRFRGIAMRTVIGETTEPIYAPGALDAMTDGDDMPEPIGYEYRLIVRFDVRFQKPGEKLWPHQP